MPWSPHLFFYQLGLIALVWLCLMLQWAWPSDPAACPTPPELPSPIPKRHREPTPFAGLTTKPHCDACEHSTDPRPQPPSAPPPRIVPPRGRRRQVDTSMHFCPNPDCAYRGWVGWGNLRANGHPNGGRWRQRVVFGTLEAVNDVLAPHGWHINTAFVERLNLTIRQHVAAVGRRVSTLCKGEDGLRQQLAVFHCYYNFCLPHASVRQPLPQPEPTHGTGSATQWRPWTPAMAAGLTDHVWTLREVLLFRVPPWPQPAGV